MNKDINVLTICLNLENKTDYQTLIQNYFKQQNFSKYEIIFIGILDKNIGYFTSYFKSMLNSTHKVKNKVGSGDLNILTYVKIENKDRYLEIPLNKGDKFLSSVLKDNNDNNYYIYSLLNFNENGEEFKNYINSSFAEKEQIFKNESIKFYSVGGKFQNNPEKDYFENSITRMMLDSKSFYNNFSEGLYSKQRDYYLNNGPENSIKFIKNKGKELGDIPKKYLENYYLGSFEQKLRIIFLKNTRFQSSQYYGNNDIMFSNFIVVDHRQVRKFDYNYYPGYFFRFMKQNQYKNIDKNNIRKFYDQLDDFYSDDQTDNDLVIDLKEVLNFTSYIEYLILTFNEMVTSEKKIVHNLEKIRTSVMKKEQIDQNFADLVYSELNKYIENKGGIDFCDIENRIETVTKDIDYYINLEKNIKEIPALLKEEDYNLEIDNDYGYIKEGQKEFGREKVVEFEKRRKENINLSPFLETISLKNEDFEGNIKILNTQIEKINDKKRQLEKAKQDNEEEKDLEYKSYILSYINSELKNNVKQLEKYINLLENIKQKRDEISKNIEYKNNFYSKEISILNTKIKEIDQKILALKEDNERLKIIRSNNDEKTFSNKTEELKLAISNLEKINKKNILIKDNAENELLEFYKKEISQKIVFNDSLKESFFSYLFDNCNNEQKIKNMKYLLSLLDVNATEEIRNINYDSNYLEKFSQNFKNNILGIISESKNENSSWFNYFSIKSTNYDNNYLKNYFGSLNVNEVVKKVLEFGETSKNDINYCEFKDIYFTILDKKDICTDEKKVDCHHDQTVTNITAEKIIKSFTEFVNSGYIVNTYVFKSESEFMKRQGQNIKTEYKRCSFNNSIGLITLSLINPNFRVFFKDIPDLNRCDFNYKYIIESEQKIG